ncbi:unnamed protein product [Adineta steineri]|uniref:Uncharacterized protein n=2 Tax=Adineta steineri TaxID=433720 RepID=A0A814VFH9_9BILA|nr:unnamed protein product [Adineta steineri]
MHSSTIIASIIVLITIVAKHSSVATHDSYSQALRRRTHAYNYGKNQQRNMFLRRLAQQLVEDEDSDENLRSAAWKRDDSASGIVSSSVYGGAGGNPYTDANIFGNSKIFVPKTIHMVQAKYVTGTSVGIGSLQTTYQMFDGTTADGAKFGVGQNTATSSDAMDCGSFNLNPNEYIVKVTGGAKAFVYWLQFTTNLGRQSDMCGTQDGDAFTVEQPGYVLSYFAGNAGKVLNTIQFYWVKLPACLSSPCQNGGACNTVDGSCTCKGQTSGPTCSTCGCQNGGTCSAKDGSCTCEGQTSGPTCSICGCQNGGTCSAVDGSCQCKGQTSGPTCSTCGCQNGGTCSATDGSCQCKGQTSGPTCSICGCQNGGTCSAKDGSCTCKGQTSGPTCSTCGCQNGGTCSATDGSCQCKGQTSGPTCSTCGCKNGGTCSAKDGSCTCKGQTSGPTCSTCGCQYGGTCDGNGNCQCKGQTSGPTCSSCGCQNGGTCDGNGNCQCKGGWTGTTCTTTPACNSANCCANTCTPCIGNDIKLPTFGSHYCGRYGLAGFPLFGIYGSLQGCQNPTSGRNFAPGGSC